MPQNSYAKAPDCLDSDIAIWGAKGALTVPPTKGPISCLDVRSKSPAILCLPTCAILERGAKPSRRRGRTWVQISYADGPGHFVPNYSLWPQHHMRRRFRPTKSRGVMGRYIGSDECETCLIFLYARPFVPGRCRRDATGPRRGPAPHIHRHYCKRSGARVAQGAGVATPTGHRHGLPRSRHLLDVRRRSGLCDERGNHPGPLGDKNLSTCSDRGSALLRAMIGRPYPSISKLTEVQRRDWM